MRKKFKFKSQKPRERWRLFGCAESEAAVAVKKPYLQLFGNSEITVEGCCGVAEYEKDFIKLRLPRGNLTVCGAEFDIVSFEGGSIRIRGSIATIEFCV